MLKRILIIFLTITFILSSVFAFQPESASALTTNIKVGYCAYFAPYQYMDSNGSPAGFNVDILERIAAKTDMVLEYVPFGTTYEAMDRLEMGEIDMVLGVIEESIFNYDVLITNPLSSTNFCLVASKEAAAIYRKTNVMRGSIALELGTLRNHALTNMGKTIVVASNQERSIEALLDGKAAFFAGLKECIMWNLKEEDRTDDYEIINNYIASANVVIAVRPGDQLLCNNINESISAIRVSKIYDELYSKWFSFYSVDYRQLFRIALFAIAAFIVAISVTLLISFRKRTARAEAESNLRYSIIESSPAGMVLIDQKHNIEYMNRNAMNLAGVSEFNVGDSVKSLGIFNEIIEKLGGDIFSSDWNSKTGSLEHHRKKGLAGKEKYRYNIKKVTPYGGLPGALLTVENITTEEREREAAFEKEKNETLNNLIAGIAHEIKNPLTAINASASMMEKKGHSEKFREAFSAYIPQEIDRITRLIDSLLDYARPGASKTEEVNLAEIIHSVYELSRVTAKKTEITLDIRNNDKLFVQGDKDKIKQSLLNLMINSIEATRIKTAKDGEIHHINIEAYNENDNIIVRIIDDGIGMTSYELEKCTAPFFTTKAAGTGIGLALTRQYIEEAEGKLVIDSEKNQFTCVEIQLPALSN